MISEAMSHGLPVIASRIGGLGEFVEDGVTGLLFQPGNSQELAEKIRLLWANPELCRRLGDAGQQKARRELNGELYYQRLTAIYEQAIELTARRRAPRPDRARQPASSHPRPAPCARLAGRRNTICSACSSAPRPATRRRRCSSRPPGGARLAWRRSTRPMPW